MANKANEAKAASVEAERARRVVLLWQQHTLTDEEIPAAAKIPPTLWGACKASGDTPPLFQIGRRVFVKTDDLRAWLDGKAAAGRPGSKRLRMAAAAPA